MLTHSNIMRYVLVASLATTALFAANVSPARAEILLGLTNTNAVVRFDSAAPTNILANTALFGFDGAEERAVSFDYRPIGGTPLTVLTVGQVDSDDVSIVGRLYDLDPTTGLLSNVRTLTASFSTSVIYTIDFNPTGPVALRVVGNDNSNYRVSNVGTGATATDTALSGDGIIVGGGDGLPVVGVAYSNNDNNVLTGTTLFNIDRAGDRLATIPVPNGGVTQQFANALGVDLSNTGFQEIDISGSGIAYGTFQLQGQGNVSRIFTLNLATGIATPTAVDNRVRLNNTNLVLRGIAALPAVAVPEINTMALLAVGLTAGRMLLARRRKSGK